MSNGTIGIKLGTITINSLSIGEATALNGSSLTLGKQDLINYLSSHDGPISSLELSDLVCKLKWGI